MADDKYYKDKKALTEKKEWTLKTAKEFYDFIESKFKGVQKKEDAIKRFKNMFTSEKEFYKHLRKHIIIKYEKYENECKTWQDAKKLDDKLNGKFSKEYFDIFGNTLSYLKEVLYQSISGIAKRRVLIYSKKRNIAVIMEGNKILSIHKNDFESLEEWIDNIKRNSKLIDNILRVGVDYELKRKSKTIQSIFRRFN